METNGTVMSLNGEKDSRTDQRNDSVEAVRWDEKARERERERERERSGESDHTEKLEGDIPFCAFVIENNL